MLKNHKGENNIGNLKQEEENLKSKKSELHKTRKENRKEAGKLKEEKKVLVNCCLYVSKHYK
jgi:hypothetical protein